MANKYFQINVDQDANLDNYRVKSQTGTGTFRYTFLLPLDLTSLISVELIGNVSAGAAQIDRNIDRFVSAHQVGQVVNQKTASDTTTLFDLSSYADKTFSFGFTSLIPSPTGGDIVGILHDHNSIGGTVFYLQIRGVYS